MYTLIIEFVVKLVVLVPRPPVTLCCKVARIIHIVLVLSPGELKNNFKPSPDIILKKAQINVKTIKVCIT